MTQPAPQQDREQARRNLRLALIHVVLALGFLAGFVWITVAQR
ncbi:hypothetical protein [Stagnimonas aquatica]|nr:hypothetical protein [Stagnimonas aquatica]